MLLQQALCGVPHGELQHPCVASHPPNTRVHPNTTPRPHQIQIRLLSTLPMLPSSWLPLLSLALLLLLLLLVPLLLLLLLPLLLLLLPSLFPLLLRLLTLLPLLVLLPRQRPHTPTWRGLWRLLPLVLPMLLTVVAPLLLLPLLLIVIALLLLLAALARCRCPHRHHATRLPLLGCHTRGHVFCFLQAAVCFDQVLPKA